MIVLKSTIDPHSEGFVQNRQEMLVLLEGIRDLERKVRTNSERALEKFRKRKQILPRERLVHLLDPGSSFIEFSTLAGYKMHDDDGEKNISGGGLITGIGRISKTDCMVMANDSGIKGGAISPISMQKILRAQDLALQNKLPLVNLVESAGGNLLYQGESFVPGGRLFYNEARLSAAGIPHIAVVHGSSTAGGAYIPGLADYCIMVRERAKVFLAGPPLLKAATGEIATDEELGGAAMHAGVSGTAEYVADSDVHAIEIARDVVAALDWPRAPVQLAEEHEEPLCDPDELAGIVPTDYRKPYDAREVIARLVDGSRFLEFKADFGMETVCGHAMISGVKVGLIANNGPIYPQGSQKAAHFIQACDQAGRPLIYLQNITGYMVGVEAEAAGAVKHGSKMIQAVSNARVPQITLVIGASFGAGNYGMCGKAFGPRFIFSWPNARTGIMGGAQVARVMSIIARGQAKSRGRDVDEGALAAEESRTIERMETETSVLYTSARLWDDGIIDPRSSRDLLVRLLRICLLGDGRTVHSNTFGVARM